MATMISTMAPKFFWRLRELREDRGLTRMDIVRQANISYQTICKLESGRTTLQLDAPVLAKLMRVLDCGMADLVTLIIDIDEIDEGAD